MGMMNETSHDELPLWLSLGPAGALSMVQMDKGERLNYGE
jgi:hypothetical protein